MGDIMELYGIYQWNVTSAKKNINNGDLIYLGYEWGYNGI